MTAENTKMDQYILLRKSNHKTDLFESVTLTTCINLILTNHTQYFIKSQALVTGISDFHAITLTIMRNTFCKGNPKTKFYRDLKKLDREMFERQLSYFLQSFQSLDYTCFHNVFLLLLNKYAPIKKKILRTNHSPFMTENLRKAIILRSQLKNKLLISRNNEQWTNYKKQQNF